MRPCVKTCKVNVKLPLYKSSVSRLNISNFTYGGKFNSVGRSYTEKLYQ